jgi:predicted  nucleic acid-binding Zn-ribbon protein
MAKLAAAHNRLFKNLFICKNCGSKIKVEPKKILDGKVSCRKCGKKKFRAMKKKQ